MIHPIFMAVLRRPDLLAGHLANYGELLRAELTSLGTALAVRAVSAVVAFVALLVALGLTGVALMLGFLHGSFHWVLAIVPGVAWLLAAISVAIAMRPAVKPKVQDVKGELAADLALLKLVKEAKDG